MSHLHWHRGICASLLASSTATAFGAESTAKGVPVTSCSSPASVKDIESVWGKPYQVVKLSNGMEERYYETNNNLKIKRVFLFKEGKTVGENAM